MKNLLEEPEKIMEIFRGDETRNGTMILLQMLIETQVIKNFVLQMCGITETEFDELIKVEKRRMGLRLLDETTIEHEKLKV
jgi:hypothetical protein